MTDSGFQLAAQQAGAYEAQTGVFMRPSASLIVDSLRLAPGDSVLDLACGTGFVARNAVVLVGPSGRVVGVDVNPAMLELARSLTAGSAIDWIDASALDLPLEADTFTHVACQQGLQFFPDASMAVAEVRRVLQPGGVFVATIWATPGYNPYIDTQLALLAEFEPSIAASAAAAAPPEADATLLALADDAGLVAAEVTLLEHTVDIADLASFFLAQTSSTPWAPVLASLSPDDRAGLVASFVERLGAYSVDGGGHAVPFASYRLSTRK